MDELANRPHRLDTFLEEPNFIRDTCLAELFDTERQLSNGRERDGCEVVRVGVYNQTVLWRRRRFQTAVLYQVGVDNRLISCAHVVSTRRRGGELPDRSLGKSSQEAVNRIVHVLVHVVVVRAYSLLAFFKREPDIVRVKILAKWPVIKIAAYLGGNDARLPLLLQRLT